MIIARVEIITAATSIQRCLCDGAHVYQLAGGDGPVLYRVMDSDSTVWWSVGASSALESCISYSGYLQSAGSEQPGPPTDPAYSRQQGQWGLIPPAMGSPPRNFWAPLNTTTELPFAHAQCQVGGPRRQLQVLARLWHRHRCGRALAARTPRLSMRDYIVCSTSLPDTRNPRNMLPPSGSSVSFSF